MVNPYKPDDKVLIQRKGIEIAATVRTTFKHEVQVRAADGELLWRTVKTIRSATEPEAGQPESPPLNPDPPSEIAQTESPEEPPASEEVVDVVEPISEQPTPEEPTPEEPTPEEPTHEEPTPGEPVSEEPASEEPASEEPASEEPVSEEPTNEEATPGNTDHQSLEQPAEPEPQKPEKGSSKSKKRGGGFLRKFLADDSYDG